LGKGLRSQIGTTFGTKAKGARYLEMTEGYINRMPWMKTAKSSDTNLSAWVK
jgi:hypothetical protein